MKIIFSWINKRLDLSRLTKLEKGFVKICLSIKNVRIKLRQTPF